MTKPRPYIDTRWSAGHARRVHKIGMEGTSKYILVSDDELRDLIRMSQETLNEYSSE